MIVGGILTAIGALPLPYGYYEFLRAVVPMACAVGVLLCFSRRPGFAMFLVVAALVFVFVKGLPKGVWALIDLVLGGTLVFGGLQALEEAPDDPPSPGPSP